MSASRPFEPQRLGSHMPERIIDFPQWKKLVHAPQVVKDTDLLTSMTVNGKQPNLALLVANTHHLPTLGDYEMIPTGVLEEHCEGVASVVAETVGYGQRVLVDHLDEARRVTFR